MAAMKPVGKRFIVYIVTLLLAFTQNAVYSSAQSKQQQTLQNAPKSEQQSEPKGGTKSGPVGGPISGIVPLIPEDISAPAIALEKVFSMIAEQSKHYVVSVLSEKFVQSQNEEFPFPFDTPFFRRFFGQPYGGGPQQRVPVTGLGSGFFIDDKGHVLTNNHVVQGVEKIHVILRNKQTYIAKILGSDSKTDLAVLELKDFHSKEIPVARLGDSDQVKTGNLVLALGAPFGLTQTVTSGIISAKGRSNIGIVDFEDFVQTDAPINPGNSGGPLINMRGEVIGINTAIEGNVGQSAGIGFSIPINMAKQILPTLLQGKPVIRGMLGVAVQNVTPSLQKQFHLEEAEGALVSKVNPDSPAEKAGIKTGDVIVDFGGKDIENSRQLQESVAMKSPGSEEKITLIRNGKELTLTAKLGKLPSGPAQPTAVAESKPLEKFGIEALTLTPELKSQLNLKNLKESQGIVITNVEPMSPADIAGLQPGDVITQVDREKVKDLAQADEVIAKAKNQDEALLLVDHNGETAFVTLEVG